MVGGEAAAAVEELISGVRRATDFAEQFRSTRKREAMEGPHGIHPAPSARLPRSTRRWRPPGPAAVPLHGLGQPPLPGLQVRTLAG